MGAGGSEARPTVTASPAPSIPDSFPCSGAQLSSADVLQIACADRGSPRCGPAAFSNHPISKQGTSHPSQGEKLLCALDLLNQGMSEAATSRLVLGRMRQETGSSQEIPSRDVAVNGVASSGCRMKETWKTSSRGVKASELDVGDSTNQLRLYDDFLDSALHASSRRQNMINVEQVKWSRILEKRRNDLFAMEKFRPYSFLVNMRRVSSRTNCHGTTVARKQKQCIVVAPRVGVDENAVRSQELSVFYSCERRQGIGGKHRRLFRERTPGLLYRSQMDAGAPPHTFAAAISYLVCRVIGNESVSKLSLIHI